MKRYFIYCLIISSPLFWSCDDFVEIDPPRTELVRSAVFDDAATAEAAVVELYTTMRKGFASGSSTGIGAITGLSSDELTFYGGSSITEYRQFNDNNVSADNFFIETLWDNIYNTIYKSNAIIEGLPDADINDGLKGQLLRSSGSLTIEN